MKRLLCIALAVAMLAFGATACKKAHKAGNDSMRAGASRISACGEQAGAAGATRVDGPASLAARDANAAPARS